MKSTFAFVALALIIAGYFFLQGDLPKAFNSELRATEELAKQFMEDIQYKDFVKAASYHSPDDIDKVDIPGLIEEKFMVKPEQLDLKEFAIVDSSMDSTGTRTRVKTKSKVHLLSKEDVKDVEMMLYFHKKDGKWYMELESSL